MTRWAKSLPAGACREAREWAQTQPDVQTAWAECPRGDWLLWCAVRGGMTPTAAATTLAARIWTSAWDQDEWGGVQWFNA